jgi:hypothetical protein
MPYTVLVTKLFKHQHKGFNFHNRNIFKDTNCLRLFVNIFNIVT